MCTYITFDSKDNIIIEKNHKDFIEMKEIAEEIYEDDEEEYDDNPSSEAPYYCQY